MNAMRVLEQSTVKAITRLQKLRNEQKHGRPRTKQWGAEMADIGRELNQTAEIVLHNVHDKSAS